MTPSLQARFLADESGATAIEYALIVALISIAIIAAVSAIGYDVAGRFDRVETCVDWDGTGTPPAGCETS